MPQKMFVVTANSPIPRAEVTCHRQAWVAAESLEKLTDLGLKGEISALPYPVDPRYVDFQVPEQAKELGEFLSS